MAGRIITFDEYGKVMWLGADKAIYEAFSDNQERLARLDYIQRYHTIKA